MSIYRSNGKSVRGVLPGTPYSRSEADAVQEVIDENAALIESAFGSSAAARYLCKYEGAVGRVRAGLQPKECTIGLVRKEFEFYRPFLGLS